jgi:putative two-component system response regulator
MVSGVEDPEVVEKALEIGAYGYIIKPFRISEVIINVSSALRRQRLEMESRMHREKLEQMVENRTVKLQEALDGIIQVMANIVESRDPYTAGHQRRVAELTCVIAQKLEYPEDRIKGIRMAGTIHDLIKTFLSFDQAKSSETPPTRVPSRGESGAELPKRKRSPFRTTLS